MSSPNQNPGATTTLGSSVRSVALGVACFFGGMAAEVSTEVGKTALTVAGALGEHGDSSGGSSVDVSETSAPIPGPKNIAPAESCSAPALSVEAPNNQDVLEKGQAQNITAAALADRAAFKAESNLWAQYIVNAMEKENYPLTPYKIALLLAFIETESSFQTDPKFTSDQVASEIGDTIASKEAEYAHVISVLKTAGLYYEYEPFLEEAKKAKSEGEVLNILHQAIDELKKKSKTVKLVEKQLGPDWEIMALGLVHSLGPVQISPLMSFSAEERIRLTPEALRDRQLKLIRDPQFGIQLAIRRLQSHQAVYGTDLDPVIGDYKGGEMAHFRATIQKILASIQPDLVIDGDLLLYTPRGLPHATQSSNTLLAAYALNTQAQLGFTNDRIDDAFAKTGKDLMEDCFIRRLFEYANKKKIDHEVVLETTKGGQSAKAQQAVSEYVKIVMDRYKVWLESLRKAIQAQKTKEEAKKTQEVEPVVKNQGTSSHSSSRGGAQSQSARNTQGKTASSAAEAPSRSTTTVASSASATPVPPAKPLPTKEEVISMLNKIDADSLSCEILKYEFTSENETIDDGRVRTEVTIFYYDYRASHRYHWKFSIMNYPKKSDKAGVGAWIATSDQVLNGLPNLFKKHDICP